MFLYCFILFEFVTFMTFFSTSQESQSKLTKDGAGLQECAVVYRKIGCFKDDMMSPRPLPKLLLTDRDLESAVSSNNTIDWNNWNGYLHDIVCRCAVAAKKHKYKYFGIQYYGECWSGKDARDTYNRAGSSTTCLGKDFKQCQNDSSYPCVGKIEENFVYEIPEIGSMPCCKAYLKIGCFKDNMKKPNDTLPKMLFTDMNFSSPAYSGVSLDWAKWDEYIVGLACRCADAASNNGYSYFSLQNYGECWSTWEHGSMGSPNERNADTCIGHHLQKCEKRHLVCVGQAKSKYVYRLRKSYLIG